MTDFTLYWCVSLLNDETDDCDGSDIEENAGNKIREVELSISWQDATEDTHTFKYTEQVNPILVLAGTSDSGSVPDSIADIIVSLIKTNDIIYFEAKIGYKKGAFVIYNSELFKATKVQKVGGGHPRDVDSPDPNNGWESFGLINDPALLANEDLPQTLFLDGTEVIEP